MAAKRFLAGISMSLVAEAEGVLLGGDVQRAGGNPVGGV